MAPKPNGAKAPWPHLFCSKRREHITTRTELFFVDPRLLPYVAGSCLLDELAFLLHRPVQLALLPGQAVAQVSHTRIPADPLEHLRGGAESIDGQKMHSIFDTNVQVAATRLQAAAAQRDTTRLWRAWSGIWEESHYLLYSVLGA